MQSPKDIHLDTENLHLHPEKVPDPESLQPRQKNEQKSVLKIKGCSPLDASSNLEFTQKRSKLYLAESLQNLKSNEPSQTIQKMQQNNSSSVSSQANKVPRRVQHHPKENDNTERIHAVIKEIFDSENELPLWKIWPGNNRFFFEGKLMTGPESDKFPNLAAWVFVIAINVIFFAAALPFLVDELMSLLPALSSYLCLSTVIFFLLTSFTDPGIIPRKYVWELDGEVPKPYCAIPRKDQTGLSHHIHRRNEENSLEFCTICQIHRPPQAAHCKFCGNCVEVFGGHLRIFNNCIGKRNYRFFVGLITSLVLLTIFYVICFVTLMVQSFQGDLGTDVGAGSGSGFADKTVNIVIGILVGVPTVIFISIKLGLFIYFLINRAHKRANPENNQERAGITLKGISADWCESEPSRVHSRKLINRTQLRKYKAALENGHIE